MSHKGVTELCVSVENKDWINLCLTLASAFPPPPPPHTLWRAHQHINRVMPSSHFKNELEGEERRGRISDCAGWLGKWVGLMKRAS